MKPLNEQDYATVLRALDDAAYYRLGEDAANEDEIEDEDDRDLFLAYRELLNRLEG